MERLLLLIFLSSAHLLMAQLPISGDCAGNLGQNIFLRGDFGSGASNVLPVDPKLAPGYVYQFAPPPNDGFYTITNNTQNWGSFAAASWIKTRNNSPDPYGYFMVVNASIQPGLFYLDTVDVCGNTNYLFTADVISMNLPSGGAGFIRPNISFLVNGNPVYESGNVPIDGQWHTYGFSFRTDPGASRIVLALRNNAPGGNGNDLGLDNISFRPCGPKIDVLDTVLYRRDSIAILKTRIQDAVYQDPRVQWQVSNNDGLSWQDVPGAMDTILVVRKPKHGNRYRVLVGDGLSQLAMPSCRVNSKDILVREDATRDTFHVAICPGGAYLAYGKSLTEPGEYEFFFPSNYQGDRVVTYIVRIEDLSDFEILGSNQICRGDTITLRAGAFGSIAWSTGEVTESIRITRPGAYSVFVTSIHGCSAADTLVVEEVVLEMELDVTAPTCYNDKDGAIRARAYTGGKPPYRFGLAGGVGSSLPEIQGLGAGRVLFRMQDTGGCKLDVPVVLNNPSPFELDTIGSNLSILLGERIALQANSDQLILQYAWKPESAVTCPDCPAPIVSPDSSMTYTLVATNVRGCLAQKVIRVQVIPVRNVYAPTAFSPNGDGTNDAFSLYFGRGVVEVGSIQIFNRGGGMVFEAENAPPNADALSWDGTLGGQPLPSGLYVWVALLSFSDGVTERWSGEVSLIR